MPLTFGNMTHDLSPRPKGSGNGVHRVQLAAGESRVIDKTPVQPNMVHNNGPGVVLIEERTVLPGEAWVPRFPGQCVFAVTTIDEATEVGID